MYISTEKKHSLNLDTLSHLSQAQGLGPQSVGRRPTRPRRHNRVRHRGVPKGDHLLAEDQRREGKDHHEWVRERKTKFSLKCSSELVRPEQRVEEDRIGYKTSSRLRISNFSSEDAGTYHCVSSNSHGSDQEAIRIYGMLMF